MKKFLLHNFLCAVMVMVAPSVGWSDTTIRKANTAQQTETANTTAAVESAVEALAADTENADVLRDIVSVLEKHGKLKPLPDSTQQTRDELWNGRAVIDPRMEPIYKFLNTDTLPVDKLLQFVVTLPRGVDAANETMNDPARTVIPIEEASWLFRNGPQLNMAAGLANTLVSGGFLLGSDGGLRNIKSRFVTRKLWTSVLFAGFGYGIFLITHSAINIKRNSLEGVSHPVQQRFGLSYHHSGVQEVCHMLVHLPFSGNRIQYKVHRCSEFINDGKASEGYISVRNNAPSIVQVQTEQGVFEYNPDSQIFETVSSAVEQ